jgi:hypothetical protein
VNKLSGWSKPRHKTPGNISYHAQGTERTSHRSSYTIWQTVSQLICSWRSTCFKVIDGLWSSAHEVHFLWFPFQSYKQWENNWQHLQSHTWFKTYKYNYMLPNALRKSPVSMSPPPVCHATLSTISYTPRSLFSIFIFVTLSMIRHRVLVLNSIKYDNFMM